MIEEIEQFKNILDYSIYQISNFGAVKNTKTGRILKNCVDSHGYCHVRLCKNGKAENFKIHKIVSKYYCSNPNNSNIVDHIDGDRLNNNYKNLRFCTLSQNNMNSKKRKNTSSVYKGISYNKNANKWCAQIAINSKDIFIGYFISENEAAKAYNEKVIELFKDFAKLNII